MKNFILLITVFVLSAASLPGFTQTMMKSAHDFQNHSWNTNTGKDVCVVCHTPHKTSVTAKAAPLWNHASTKINFIIYAGTTMQEIVGQPDGNSKLCLSCHDGTVAVANAGSMTTKSKRMIGINNPETSLTNDHRVSFTYNTALTKTDLGLHDPSLQTGIGNTTIDASMLFDGKMQCASCHDVHNLAYSLKTNSSSLLIKSNNASELCLTCHKK